MQRYHFFVLRKNLSFILRSLKKKRRKKAREEGTKGRKKEKRNQALKRNSTAVEGSDYPRQATFQRVREFQKII